MWRSHRAELTSKFTYALGVTNLLILIFGPPTALTLSVAILLSPFLLATALQLTAVIACSVLSYALGDRRDRAELLVNVIAAMLPAGELYREAMVADLREAPPELVWPIARNLMATAPQTVLEAAWVHLPMPLRKRPGARGGRPVIPHHQ